jgi:hypothetical protein
LAVDEREAFFVKSYIGVVARLLEWQVDVGCEHKFMQNTNFYEKLSLR